MNAIIKKALFDKLREVPLNNIIKSFTTVEKPILNNNSSTSNNTDQGYVRQQMQASKDRKILYLNSKLIDFSQGWNTINVSICQNAKNNIHIHPNSGTALKLCVFKKLIIFHVLFFGLKVISIALSVRKTETGMISRN
jgi:hypothetical protein